MHLYWERKQDKKIRRKMKGKGNIYFEISNRPVKMAAVQWILLKFKGIWRNSINFQWKKKGKKVLHFKYLLFSSHKPICHTTKRMQSKVDIVIVKQSRYCSCFILLEQISNDPVEMSLLQIGAGLLSELFKKFWSKSVNSSMAYPGGNGTDWASLLWDVYL